MGNLNAAKSARANVTRLEEALKTEEEQEFRVGGLSKNSGDVNSEVLRMISRPDDDFCARTSCRHSHLETAQCKPGEKLGE